MDGRDNNGKPIITYEKEYGDETRKIMLGHSCEEWVIGTPEEAKEFIVQLEDVIKRAEANPEQDID